MLSKEEKKDILFQIDMQLYDEFNDKFCEMNDNLGTVYSYKDLDDLEKLEKETEIKLLRQAIEKQSKEIEELKEKNKKLQDKAKELIFEKQELTSALLDSTPNDKIKAKIEEIKKNKENIYFEEHLESILQSLLEKE